MNIHMLLIAQLVLFAACIQSRAIDDVDNSIENVGGGDAGGETQVHQQRTPFEQDWIKFAKKPPTKLLQTLGQPVEIVCEVMGSQVPTIQWVVGHLPLSEVSCVNRNSELALLWMPGNTGVPGNVTSDPLARDDLDQAFLDPQPVIALPTLTIEATIINWVDILLSNDWEP
ncbi:PREDICTED: neural/ectodermal development factor IMP-L2-like [Rhagoletis zephyria]|uniref:neural/ectodermal development factor IMP-L2-like n=1 Tax=Rhagoletis zephyria TaxID=28612 RepID=UPI000811A5BB|nr:PREDICTED: neural/ectodermal development factor IMP-L2-like [Rhagoletis zephyria]